MFSRLFLLNDQLFELAFFIYYSHPVKCRPKTNIQKAYAMQIGIITANTDFNEYCMYVIYPK